MIPKINSALRSPTDTRSSEAAVFAADAFVALFFALDDCLDDGTADCALASAAVMHAVAIANHPTARLLNAPRRPLVVIPTPVSGAPVVTAHVQPWAPTRVLGMYTGCTPESQQPLAASTDRRARLRLIPQSIGAPCSRHNTLPFMTKLGRS